MGEIGDKGQCGCKKNVYLVWDYSDYYGINVRAVCDSQEEAKKIVKEYNPHSWAFEKYEIQDFNDFKKKRRSK